MLRSGPKKSNIHFQTGCAKTCYGHENIEKNEFSLLCIECPAQCHKWVAKQGNIHLDDDIWLFILHYRHMIDLTEQPYVHVGYAYPWECKCPPLRSGHSRVGRRNAYPAEATWGWTTKVPTLEKLVTGGLGYWSAHPKVTTTLWPSGKCPPLSKQVPTLRTKVDSSPNCPPLRRNPSTSCQMPTLKYWQGLVRVGLCDCITGKDLAPTALSRVSGCTWCQLSCAHPWETCLHCLQMWCWISIFQFFFSAAAPPNQQPHQNPIQMPTLHQERILILSFKWDHQSHLSIKHLKKPSIAKEQVCTTTLAPLQPQPPPSAQPRNGIHDPTLSPQL